jgi:multicomponent Na+:H+ antiporter subunit G
MIEYILLVFVIIGLLFNLLGIIGLFRFPDVYTRLHASTKCTTFGSMFIYMAVVVFGIVMAIDGKSGFSQLSIHTIIALIALFLTNPTGAHAIAKAAHNSGVKPKCIVDKLEASYSIKK